MVRDRYTGYIPRRASVQHHGRQGGGSHPCSAMPLPYPRSGDGERSSRPVPGRRDEPSHPPELVGPQSGEPDTLSAPHDVQAVGVRLTEPPRSPPNPGRFTRSGHTRHALNITTRALTDRKTRYQLPAGQRRAPLSWRPTTPTMTRTSEATFSAFIDSPKTAAPMTAMAAVPAADHTA